jgi:hypothetical protein
MIWFVILIVLICLGLWWDTAREKRKIYELVDRYLTLTDRIGQTRDCRDLLAYMEEWLGAQ